ncbi:MAG: hypothetical protein M3Q29_26090 [Chloroflexota bacterium]|nr:hypothetical protein [Chloroflexota bacterium]
MSIVIERRRTPPATELTEIVTPRTNTAAITPVENMLASISTREPFSLEIAATHTERRFLMRAASPEMSRRLTRQVSAAYPQAGLRPVDSTSDPALPNFGERVAACVMTLREPEYLPIRTFRDDDVDGERTAQADPVLGTLASLGDLPQGWRALAQLVLHPALGGWARGYAAMASRAPLPVEEQRPSLAPVGGLAILAAFTAIGLHGYTWYSQGQWLRLALLAVGVLFGLPALAWLWMRRGRKVPPDPVLVSEKLSRPAYLAQLRLVVFAPDDVPDEQLMARLSRIAPSFSQYDLPTGNAVVPVPVRAEGRDLRCLDPLQHRRSCPILNTRELAGLWHLPRADADLPLLERTTERRRLPDPRTVSKGCPVGVSEHQGKRVEVCVPEDVLERNSLLVAKTRRGKSSLMLRLAQYIMERPDARGKYRGMVLVDPHTDLAREALALVPAERRDSVVYLDVSNADRPFGLNLLDTVLWPDRDRAVSSTLTIFNREFDRSWGSRMEDAFRFGLLTLYEANQSLCRANASGRGHQYTVLDAPALYDNPHFRNKVLEQTSDPGIRDWWNRFERKDRRLQEEITTPVKTKIHRFAGSRAGQGLVGQPASTIDPTAWLRDGAVVIVDTAKSIVGEGTSALIGATLINLVAMVVAQQAEQETAKRRSVTFLVDEFHSIPGADYEYILGELAKYGANLVLATQGLSSLDATDRENNRRLRQKVFSNIDALFAFHVSAEDARYLAPELGSAVEEEDLGELGNHRCYARFTSNGERLPSFSIQLLPPPEGDPRMRNELAAASASRYGRDRKLVDVDLRLALARVELAGHEAAEANRGGSSSTAGTGTLVVGGRPDGRRKQRSKDGQSHNRPPGTVDSRPTTEARQLTLVDQSADAPTHIELDGDAPPIPEGEEEWEENER